MPISTLSGRSRLPLFFLIMMDLGIAFFCAELTKFFRFGPDDPRYLHLIVLQALLVVVFSLFCNVYAPWRGRPFGTKMASVFFAWLLSFAALLAYLVMSKTTETYSRLWLAIWVCTAIPAALLMRFALYKLLRVFRRRGRNTRHVLIIGSGKNFAAMQSFFSQDNGYGYRLAHIIDYKDEMQVLTDLESYLAQGKMVDECWLCIPFTKNIIIHPVMYAMRHSTANIRYMPEMHDLHLMNYDISMIGNFYSMNISCSPMDSINAFIKRSSDIIFASLILLLISPLMIAVAIAVKLSSPGPVLFKQYRHGANGKPVKIYKFRSMKLHQEDNDKVTQASKGDPRVTRVGAFIRRTSLDELPQFINVLQGRMSVVGPRPHALVHNDYYKELVESYMQRHKVKPGISGLAQVRGFRGETDTLDKMQRRVECDLEYINNWSLWLDVKIIIGTVFKGFMNPNAY